MWWIKDITVTKGTTKASPVEEVAKLTPGTIERVIVFFPPGCLGYVKVALYEAEHQFMPEDIEGHITGDDYVFDMVHNKELKAPPAYITIKAWNTATTYDHTITVGIFLRETARGRISRAVQGLFGMAGETVEV